MGHPGQSLPLVPAVGNEVKGPQKYSEKFPLPGVKDGYDSPPQLGVGHSMKLLFEEVDYRDTAVVAFRTPTGSHLPARADLPAKRNRQ